MIKKVTCTAFVLMLVALFVLSAAPPANAQAVYGSIIGTVTDPQGAAVPNAKITVTDVRKGTSDVYTTNESGNYSVTHLIPDVYDMKVEAPGFKTAEQKGVNVVADAAARTDIKMQLGSVSEAVEVTAEAPQLKTDRADVATTFNEKYVEDLPVLGRNFTTFELLSPGTQKLVGWNHASTENPQGAQQIFVNGQHFSGTGYELDGTDNQDPILGIIVINPNLDAITETKINFQNYDAEFGKAVAGIVTVQTKSGSNDFHGEGFWFRRTDATEARDPFTQYKPDPITGRFIPKDRWNQFGGTFGGPVVKNKLFFFADYQGTRQASGITQSLTIPTAQVINTCTGAGDGSGYCKLDQYTSNFGTGANSLLYDPWTGTIDSKGNPVNRTPFCGMTNGVLDCATKPNWIPLSRISSQAQQMLKLLPSPTNSGVSSNLIASGSAPYSNNTFDTRVDWSASQSINVFGRFSLARFQLSGTGLLGGVDGPGNGLGGLAGSAITHNYSLATGFTKTFSGTLLTDFRLGWFRYNPTTHKPSEGKTPMEDIGIPHVNGTLFTSGWGSFQNMGPLSNMGDGLNVGRCNCPLIERENQWQFNNNWTKIVGNHTFKFGADIRRATNLRVPSDADRAGVYNFDSGPTSNGTAGGGNGLGSFMLGYVHNMSRFVSTSTNAQETQWRTFYYGQDTWRVTPKLTVNYGLRWEVYFPESVNGKDNGGFANLEEGLIRIAGEGPYGTNGNVQNTWKAFAPRIGFAYQVTPKTVIRMGYGRSFDIGVFGSNFGHAVTQNLPVLVNQNTTATNNFGSSTQLVGNVQIPIDPVTGNPIMNDQYFAAFALNQGPPEVSTSCQHVSNGALPLNACGGQPRMRPTTQRLPTIDAWNLTIQRQLTNTMSLEVSYVGNKATHTFAGNGPAYDANQINYGPGTSAITGKFQNGNPVPNGTACNYVDPDPALGAVKCSAGFNATTPADQRRPFFNKFSYPDGTTCCTGGTMGNYFGNDSSSNYNALQVKLEKRFTQGFQFMTNFTWSKAMNHSSDNGFLYSVAPQSSYGPDDMNRDKVWIFNATYELPFGKGKRFAGGAGRALDLIIGGWQITDTTNVSSGLPWTANAGECNLTVDTGPCLPELIGSFKVGAGSLQHPANSQPVVPYFAPVTPMNFDFSSLTVGQDTCQLARPTSGPFQLSPCGTYGLVGRNSMRGPGAFFDDMSVQKNFHITERFNAQFRMDAFNVFNHPVLGFSSQDYAATGGTCIDCIQNASTGAYNGLIKDIQDGPNKGTTMRQLQFGLKLIF